MITQRLRPLAKPLVLLGIGQFVPWLFMSWQGFGAFKQPPSAKRRSNHPTGHVDRLHRKPSRIANTSRSSPLVSSASLGSVPPIGMAQGVAVHALVDACSAGQAWQ
jgi:hypothetical protein